MYILFDIGGTKTRVAMSTDCVSFGEPVKFDTPHDFNEALSTMARIACELADGTPIVAVAGGVRGQLDSGRTMLLRDSVLTEWAGKPLAEVLGTVLKAPVYLENDAALAGLGEAHFGAGKGFDIVAFHTVSTGVGGARIEKGRINATRVGFEPGKQIIDPERSLCPTCPDGTLEGLVSGSAVEKRFGKKPYEIKQHDPLWDELALWLSYGLKNTTMYWSPDVIVLGGSMILGNPRIYLEDIKRHMGEVMADFPYIPTIVDAKLGDNGGLYGALALLSSVKAA